MLLSRKWFELLVRTPPECLTDINRAARYFVLQKCAFGGRVARQNFAIHVTKRPTFSPRRIPEIINAAYERLQEVQIECLPYERVIEKYDRETTFFYLDPPYYGLEFYKHNLSANDFKEMESRLRSLNGKFIFSINDHPEIRRLFAAYRLEEITLPYSIQKHAGRRYTELLIRNY